MGRKMYQTKERWVCCNPSLRLWGACGYNAWGVVGARACRAPSTSGPAAAAGAPPATGANPGCQAATSVGPTPGLLRFIMALRKSMFGSQELSNRRSAPAHGFGSSTRNHASKVFMGPEHAKTSVISCTPGPCYEVNGACGNQHDSGKNSPPQWCFGTAGRFAGATRTATPGPGAYENMCSFGKQGLSNHSTFPLYGFGTVDRTMASKVFISPAHAASSFGLSSPGPAAAYTKAGGLSGPKYGFGTDDRFQRLGRRLSDSAELPGPGSYSSSTTDSTLGSQHSSRLTTQPAFGFGTSNRDHSARIFVSDMHSKSVAGPYAASPGPAVYSLNSSIGTQTTSRGRSAPSWGFGKAARLDSRAYMTDTPGPGSYAT